MSKPSLDEFLKQLEISEPSAEIQKAQIELALADSNTVTGEKKISSRRWTTIAIAAGIAALIAVPMIYHAPAEQKGLSQIALQKPISDRQKLFRETKQVFSDQLAGIVSEKGNVRVVLSDDGIPRDSAPILITISDSGGKIDIISYSGQTIPVSIDGKNIDLDVLMDGNGKILISGNDFVWTQGSPDPKTGMQLHASLLGGV